MLDYFCSLTLSFVKPLYPELISQELIYKDLIINFKFLYIRQFVATRPPALFLVFVTWKFNLHCSPHSMLTAHFLTLTLQFQLKNRTLNIPVLSYLRLFNSLIVVLYLKMQEEFFLLSLVFFPSPFPSSFDLVLNLCFLTHVSPVLVVNHVRHHA